MLLFKMSWRMLLHVCFLCALIATLSSCTKARSDDSCQGSPAENAVCDSVGTRPSRPPIVIVPGYEGSLLRNFHSSPGNKFKPSTLFLAPVTEQSSLALLHQLSQKYNPITDTYNSLYDLRANDRMGDVSTIEYPVATCAPPPISTIAHCVPVPGEGPLHRFAHKLRTEYGYVNNNTLFGAPYDWRLPPHQLLRHDDVGKIASWASKLHQLLSHVTSTDEARPPAVLVAHGYGCVLASQFLANLDRSQREKLVSHLWCLAAPLSGTASAALELFTGFGLHGSPRTLHSYENVRSKERLDFRAMEFELGLRRARRQPLPVVPGVWDDDDDVSPNSSIRLTPPMPSAVPFKREYGSLVAMLPSRTRGHLVDNKVVIAFNTTRKYVADPNEMKKIALEEFRDMKLVRHIAGVLRDSLASVSNSSRSMTSTAPRVRTYCVFGSNVPTPGVLHFDKPSQSAAPAIDWVSGDGIVEVANLDSCGEWANEQQEQVNMEKIANVEHFDLIGLSSSLFAYLDKLGLQLATEKSDEAACTFD